MISHSGERNFFLIWNLGRTLIIWTDTRCSFLKFLLNDGDLTWAAQAHNEEKAVFHVKSVYIIITIIAAVFFRKLFRSFSSFFWLSFSFFVWSASERKCDKSIRNNDLKPKPWIMWKKKTKKNCVAKFVAVRPTGTQVKKKENKRTKWKSNKNEQINWTINKEKQTWRDDDAKYTVRHKPFDLDPNGLTKRTNWHDHTSWI